MPRSSERSIDAVLDAIISPLASRLAQAIAKQIAETVATRLEGELPRTVAGSKTGPARARRSRSRGETTRWVADVRARRVPTFVIEATGLDTKKKIVAKYGANAVFEKGKPLPKDRENGGAGEKVQVKAKPPTLRKKGSAAA